VPNVVHAKWCGGHMYTAECLCTPGTQATATRTFSSTLTFFILGAGDLLTVELVEVVALAASAVLFASPETVTLTFASAHGALIAQVTR